MSEREHFTAAVCVRICVRRHARAASGDAALDAARSVVFDAARAAIESLRGDVFCEVESSIDYAVAYPSFEVVP